MYIARAGGCQAVQPCDNCFVHVAPPKGWVRLRCPPGIEVLPPDIKFPGGVEFPRDIKLDRGHRARLRHRSQSDRPLMIDILDRGITTNWCKTTDPGTGERAALPDRGVERLVSN